MKKKLVIFGNTYFAEVAAFYFSKDSAYEIAAFSVDGSYLKKSTFFEKPNVAFEELEKRFPASEVDLFVAIGHKKMNHVRAAKLEEAKRRGYGLANYVSSKIIAYQAPVTGEHCFILENNTIQPFTRIGSNVIMWSSNHLGHHSTVEDHCFISSHVCIGGKATVERNCFLGMNSTIRDGIRVGAESFIGPNSLILSDTKPKSVIDTPESKARPFTSERIRL